jgi:hypothetical protein
MVTGASGNLAMALGPSGRCTMGTYQLSRMAVTSLVPPSQPAFGASFGATYRVNPNLVLGASYLLKSSLDDMDHG